MDVLSHGLWGVAIARRRVRWWLAAASGSIPDIIAFLPTRVVELIEGRPNLYHEVRPMSAYPAITQTLYELTHSVTGVAAVALLSWAVFARFPSLAARCSVRAADPLGPRRLAAWVTAPWAFHVASDVPFHTLHFFPTPLLWPFSDWVFGGIPWAQPAVLVPNLVLLGLALWWTWPVRRAAGHGAGELGATSPGSPPGS
jgi:hypothetical protein